MGRQLVFDLARAPAYEADDFLVSPSNEAAVASVERWPDWPSRTILVTGPAGSGKSHLGAIWAAMAHATILSRDRLLETSIWAGGGRRVLLEDCDRRTLIDPDLFHALNLVRETGGWMMLTARTPPAAWGVRTPDLASRLRLADHAEIGVPDLALMKAVLVKLFADRQIAIDEDVVNYAARHCDRSLAAIEHFVRAVDDITLESGRRITRSLAAATMRSLGRSDADQGPT